jgi:hypothetical protein
MSLLKDYITASQMNYLYPFGVLPSNFFFRKPNPLPYYLSNELNNIETSLDSKQQYTNADMMVSTATKTLPNNIVLSDSSLIKTSPNCYTYDFTQENFVEGDVFTEEEMVMIDFDINVSAPFSKVALKSPTPDKEPCDTGFLSGLSGELIILGKDAAGDPVETKIEMSTAIHKTCYDIVAGLYYEIVGKKLKLYWTKTHSIETVAADFIAPIEVTVKKAGL